MKTRNRGKSAFCTALALTLCLILTCVAIPALGEGIATTGIATTGIATTGIATTDNATTEAAAEEAKLDMFEIFSESKLDLEPYRGKAIFINFFTEWCPNCVAEMPDIKKAFDTYSRDDLEIILVHVWQGEDAKNSENVRNTFGLHDMTFFEDEDMGLTLMLGVPGYPTSLFIDAQGNYEGAVVGGLNFEGLTEILDEMGVPKAQDGQADQATDAVTPSDLAEETVP